MLLGKNTYCLVISLLVFVFNARAQEPVIEEPDSTLRTFIDEEENEDDKIIAFICHHLPEYPGGHEAMMKFLSENIQYPKEAKEKECEGRSIIRFTVTETGKIDSVIILKSAGNEQLDEEAVRVVKLMPDWIPMKINGKGLRERMVLPIVFKLD